MGDPLSVLAHRMRKLMYRVVFPFELKLRNTSKDCMHVDDAYQLFAVVVHVGSGPNHGMRSPQCLVAACICFLCSLRTCSTCKGSNKCWGG